MPSPTGLAALKDASDSDIEYWARNVKLGEEKGWTKTLWGKWMGEDKAAKEASDMARSDKLDAEGYVPVRIAYADKDKFKRKFPSARWDNARRSWMVPASDYEKASVWES